MVEEVDALESVDQVCKFSCGGGLFPVCISTVFLAIRVVLVLGRYTLKQARPLQVDVVNEAAVDTMRGGAVAAHELLRKIQIPRNSAEGKTCNS